MRNGRGVGGNRFGRGQCQDSRCIQMRTSYGNMCAARACVQRDLERLEAQIGMREIRRGRNGSIPAHLRRVEGTGDAATVREDLHSLRHRLRGVRAVIREARLDEDENRDLKITAYEAELHRLHQIIQTAISADEVEGTFASIDSLVKMIAKEKTDSQPMKCVVCLEDLADDNFMTGKNCYHACCLTCIATCGMTSVKPVYAAEDNQYWEFERMRQNGTTNPDGSPQIEPVYRLRPEYSDDGETATAFPVNVWVACPTCRDDHYSNKTYYDLCKTALTTMDEDEHVAQPRSPSDVIQEMRDEDFLVLLEVPDMPDRVMIMEAKMPGEQLDPKYPKGPALMAAFKACGFKYSFDGSDCGGAKGFWRPQQPDDTVNPPDFRGGKLEKTKPRSEYFNEPTGEHDEEGNEILRRRKQPPGPGSWKFTYPRPQPANGEAGPSGSSPLSAVEEA